ncbi:MAG: DUF3558 domain-containing protein [Pseudonocardiaceae bacterium]
MVLVGALATAATLVAGCSQAEGGSTAPSPGASAISQERPQLSPTVENPRDVREYGDRPCAMFTTEQLTGFGFDIPPSRALTLPSGNQVCVWIDSRHHGELAVTTYPDWDILERTYLNNAGSPLFEPLRIAGLPAVVQQAGSLPTCNVTVGLAERQGLDVEFSDLTEPYEDPCGAARAAAEVAVGNLPPLE